MPAIVYSDLYEFSSYTLREGIEEVREDLGFDADDDTILGDNFLIRTFNAGQRELAVLTEAFYYTTVMGVTSGVAEYALPADTAGRALSILAVYYSTWELPYVKMRDLDQMFLNWPVSNITGTPTVHSQRGVSSIIVQPTPAATSGDVLTIVSSVIPPNVSEDEENFRVPHGCEDALKTYVKLHSAIKDRSGEGANVIPYFTNEWEKAKKTCIRVVSEANRQHRVQVGRRGLYPVGPWVWNRYTANPIS